MKRTQSSFVSNSQAIHENFYDYSLSTYDGANNKVIIICPKHGQFEQNAAAHLSGKGCVKCGREKSGKLPARLKAIGKRLTNQQFIERANKKHNCLYDYSLVNYINSHTNIDIICKIHGVFSQEPTNHLEGKGCNLCGAGRATNKLKSTKEDFIQKANDIHNNKYDYSLVEYKNARTKVKILCPKHNYYFEQTPDNHVRGNGCLYCSHSVSNVETLWLDIMKLPNDKLHRQVSITINNKLVKVDGYDPESKIVYEFYGDFWHGNPNIYKAEDINFMTKITFGSMYEKTMDKEKLLKDNGFNLITIWQTDFINQYKSLYSLQCLRARR